ncbi:MAG: hypothetical protein ACLR8P_10475 [Clostridium fessum]
MTEENAESDGKIADTEVFPEKAPEIFQHCLDASGAARKQRQSIIIRRNGTTIVVQSRRFGSGTVWDCGFCMGNLPFKSFVKMRIFANDLRSFFDK